MGQGRDFVSDILVRKDSSALRDFANELTDAAVNADTLDTSLQDIERDSAALDARIGRLKTSIAQLGLEFARTGDNTLLGDIRGQRSVLTQLERVRKEIEQAGDGGIGVTLGSAIGTSAGNSMVGGILGSVAELPAQLKGVGLAAGAALAVGMAPVASALISAGVLGGIGTGGVIGGAVLASKHPDVQSAWRTMGDDLNAKLTRASGGFVAPLIDSADRFGKAFDRADIDGTLARAAVLVAPLTEGAAGFVEQLGPGLRDAVEGSRPVVKALSEELPELGGSVSSMLSDISDAGPSASVALRDVFDVMEQGVEATGGVLKVLSEAYQFTRASLVTTIVPLTGLSGPATEMWRSISGGMQDTSVVAARLNNEMQPLPGTISKVSSETRELNRDLAQYLRLQMDLAEAGDDFEAAWDDVREAMKKNGSTLDATTAKGRENRDAWRDLIRAAQVERERMAANPNTAGAANAVYEAQIKAIERLAAKSKITADRLRELAGDYRVTVTYREINQPPRWLISGDVRVYGGRHLQGFATGGDAPEDEPFWAGERGPEIVFPNGRSQYVMSSRDSRRYVESRARGSSGGGLGSGSDQAVLAREIGRAVAQAVQGLTVVLDGQRVGSVQAAAADRFRRGG